MKRLTSSQITLIEQILPFYNLSCKQDIKNIELFKRVLKDGCYSEKDAITLNHVRTAHKHGVFEQGISHDTQLERTADMLYKLKLKK